MKSKISINNIYCQNKIVSTSIEASFKSLCEQWTKEYTVKLVNLATSNPIAKTRTESYEKMIQLGEPALPLMIQKLTDGEYLFNRAVMAILSDVTGEELVKDSEILSEQAISRRLIDYYEKQYVKTKAEKEQKKNVLGSDQVSLKLAEATPEIVEQYLQTTYIVLVNLSKKEDKYCLDVQKFRSFIDQSSFESSIFT